MYEDDVIATAFAAHVCLPLMRKAGTDLSKEDAQKVLEDCLRVLFYRNTKSSPRVCCTHLHSAPFCFAPRPAPLYSKCSLFVYFNFRFFK